MTTLLDAGFIRSLPKAELHVHLEGCLEADLLFSLAKRSGLRALDDQSLVRDLVSRQIPLTVCPLSNVKLHVVPTLADHPLKQMLDAGLNVSVNSDDPAYFGGYLAQTYSRSAAALGLEARDLSVLAANSLGAAFS